MASQISQKTGQFFLRLPFPFYFIFLFICCTIEFPFTHTDSLSSISWTLSDHVPITQASESSLDLEGMEQAVWLISDSVYTGTAFAVGPNQFVTNFHVIYPMLKEKNSLKNIMLLQEDKVLFIKRALKVNSVYDLVLFETQEEVENYLSIEDIFIEKEEELFTVGYPRGLLTKVSKTEGAFYKDDFSYIFPVNHSDLPGSSGSPLFNKKKQLAGVVYLAFGNILHVIQVKYLEEFINKDTKNCPEWTDFKFCFDREIESLKIRAEQGEALAQYALASHYDEGSSSGEEINWDLALYWYEESARQGYLPAQLKLIEIYYDGRGVERNIALAVYWCEQAVKQGYAPAQSILADIYYLGEGVERNQNLAFRLYEASAGQGYAPAQAMLADLYYHGKGVERNQNLAFRLYEASAGQGYAPAQAMLADLYYHGRGVQENKSLSFKLYGASAGQGYAPAQAMLALMYYYGEGIVKDLSLAVYWHKQFTEQDIVSTQVMLADLYYHGEGIMRKRNLAFELNEVSAKQGYAPYSKSVSGNE